MATAEILIGEVEVEQPSLWLINGNSVLAYGGGINGGKRARMKGAMKAQHRWSAEVMKTSNALDLEPSLFTWKDPRRIARSLKRSAEASTRRKGTPFQSAMSMLNFHINRGGKAIPGAQKNILQRAKVELRKLFGRAA